MVTSLRLRERKLAKPTFSAAELYAPPTYSRFGNKWAFYSKLGYLGLHNDVDIKN